MNWITGEINDRQWGLNTQAVCNILFQWWSASGLDDISFVQHHHHHHNHHSPGCCYSQTIWENSPLKLDLQHRDICENLPEWLDPTHKDTWCSSQGRRHFCWILLNASLSPKVCRDWLQLPPTPPPRLRTVLKLPPKFYSLKNCFSV